MVKTIYDGYTPLAQHNKNEKYKKQLTGCLLNGHLLTLKKTNQLRTSFPFSKKLFKGKSFLGSFLALSKQPNQPKKRLPLLSFLLPLANPFLLFLGGFYSQRKGLQGAASRVFWQLVCKWGGCLGGCSCRKQGEEKEESDGQVG